MFTSLYFLWSKSNDGPSKYKRLSILLHIFDIACSTNVATPDIGTPLTFDDDMWLKDRIISSPTARRVESVFFFKCPSVLFAVSFKYHSVTFPAMRPKNFKRFILES